MISNATPTITYDPYDPRMREDPWETFRLLRDHAPVYHDTDHDIWVLSRFADVRDAARDAQRFSSAQGVTILLDATGQITPTPLGPGDFLEMDNPQHDELRSVVRSRFTPAAVAKLEVEMREIAHALLDEIIEAGHGDLAAEFGNLLPSRVITRMLGLADADSVRLSRWFAQATDLPQPGQDQAEWSQEMLEGAGNMMMYLGAAIEERRGDPRDDILSQVAAAEIDGQPIAEAAVGICFLLYAAGEDTTVGLITTIIRTLAESEPHRLELVADPSLIPTAIDEFLRWDGPFLHLARMTTEPVTLHDVTIPADARVLLLWASANRDEHEYDHPDVLDFHRGRVAHLGFGHGLHHCIGHVLAKLEAKVAIEVLLSRIPEFTIDGPVTPGNKPFIRGYRGLPARFPAGPRHQP